MKKYFYVLTVSTVNADQTIKYKTFEGNTMANDKTMAYGQAKYKNNLFESQMIGENAPKAVTFFTVWLDE